MERGGQSGHSFVESVKRGCGVVELKSVHAFSYNAYRVDALYVFRRWAGKVHTARATPTGRTRDTGTAAQRPATAPSRRQPAAAETRPER